MAAYHIPPKVYDRLYAALVFRQALYLDIKARRKGDEFSPQIFIMDRTLIQAEWLEQWSPRHGLACLCAVAEPQCLATNLEVLLLWDSSAAVDRLGRPTVVKAKVPDVVSVKELEDIYENWPRPWLVGHWGDLLAEKGTFQPGRLRSWFSEVSDEAIRQALVPRMEVTRD